MFKWKGKMDRHTDGDGDESLNVEVRGEVERTVVTRAKFEVRFHRDKYGDLKVARSKLRDTVIRVLIGLGTSVAGAAIWYFLR